MTTLSRGRLLLANSSVALVLAAITAVTLHEGGHAVAGLVRGLTPTLSANAVDYSTEPSRSTQLVTAAAGPLLSLVLGLLCYVFGRSAGRGFLRLFGLWLALVSMQNFFGSLFIAPFARVGDTGMVMELLGAPAVAYVVMGLLGAFLTVFNARLLAGQIVRYAQGTDQLRHTVLFPWLIGTAVVVALTLLNQTRAGLGPGTVPAPRSPGGHGGGRAGHLPGRCARAPAGLRRRQDPSRRRQGRG